MNYLSQSSPTRPRRLSCNLSSICALMALILCPAAPPAAQPNPVLFPSAAIDSQNVVHLAWYAPQISDYTIPATLPQPVRWLEPSADHALAIAFRLTTGADSAALHAVDLYSIEANTSADLSCAIWTDLSGVPGRIISTATRAARDSLLTGPMRYFLDFPLHIRSGESVWIVAAIPRSGTTGVGLYPARGPSMISHQDTGPPVWEPWPDYSLAAVAVITPADPDAISAPDSNGSISVFRTAGTDDTIPVATLTRDQNRLSDFPPVQGADATYIWRDTAHSSLATLQVPYSQATALWGIPPDCGSIVHDSAPCCATFINRSGSTLDLTIQPQLAWPDTASSGPPPSVIVTPSRFLLGPRQSTDVLLQFTVPPAASGTAVLILTATDSGSLRARPLILQSTHRFGVTSVRQPSPAEVPLPHPYPNPTNTGATIPLPAGTREIAVYNIRGALIERLRPAPGVRTVRWPRTGSIKAVPSGTYLVRIRTSGGAVTRTITLLK